MKFWDSASALEAVSPLAHAAVEARGLVGRPIRFVYLRLHRNPAGATQTATAAIRIALDCLDLGAVAARHGIAGCRLLIGAGLLPHWRR